MANNNKKNTSKIAINHQDYQRQGLRPLNSRWGDPEYIANLETTHRMRESQKLDLHTASDIQSRPKIWVYPDWLEEGEVTILVGPIDGGKTTLECMLAAGVTVGSSFSLHPGLTPEGAGHVIIINLEDDFETFLKPCLEVAGADLDKVHIIGRETAPGDDSPFSFSNERDITRLMSLADRLNNNIGLLIVDPIYFAVDGDPNSNHKARQAYERLTALSKRLTCAVLGVSHAVENSLGRKALRRVAGPPALRQVPRAAMLLSKISNGPTETGGTYVLVHAKNKGRMDGGFEYCIKSVEVPGQNGTKTAPKFVVTRELTGSADDILDQADRGITLEKMSKLDLAVKFLQMVLRDGPLLRIEIEKLAEEADVKIGTLLAAKSLLMLVTKKRKGDGRSVWCLTDAEDTSNLMD
jgi:hypothetical protein